MQSDGIDPTQAAAGRGRGDDRRLRHHASTSPAPTTRPPGFTNMPAASAMGAISIAFLMLLDAGGLSIPTNAGLFASMQTVFREGLAHRPASSRPRRSSATRCATRSLESIMTALAEPLPDRVCAGWNQFLPASLSGVDPRTGERLRRLPAVLARRLRRDAGHRRLRRARLHRHAGRRCARQDMEIFELSTPHLVDYVETRDRLGRRGRVARRLRHARRGSASTARACAARRSATTPRPRAPTPAAGPLRRRGRAG